MEFSKDEELLKRRADAEDKQDISLRHEDDPPIPEPYKSAHDQSFRGPRKAAGQPVGGLLLLPNYGNYILDSRKGRKIVHKSVKAKPPSALDAITDVVLAYRPKPKSKAGQKRKRKEKKLAK